MTAVASIVEGDGEVGALPVLLRRIGEWLTPQVYTEILPPIRVRRDRFLNKDDEFRRFLLLAAAKCGERGFILIVLDSDDDCPATKCQWIIDQARQIVPHRRVSAIFANREYEAWFIAAAMSLTGKRGFSCEADELIEAESRRNAKGWIREHMASGTYDEITDQPAFSASIELRTAHERSRSFRKLCKEWQLNAEACEKDAN